MKACRQRVEDPIHRAIFHFLKVVLPHGAAVTLHHSPNEEMDKVQRVRAAGLGTRAGWPDLEWHGRFDDGTPYSAKIEVKAPRRTLSDAQTACHDGLMDAGVLVGVARSIDDARVFLRRHKIPTREAA